jgi:2-keto-3-deoxy-L-rhamnonate aldolase RhmA
MNAFRQLLRASRHRVSIGTWISSASPIVAEAVGHAGFDWGVVDMEHTAIDVMGVLHVLQAVANTKMVPVVSVPADDAATVNRVLDAGASTLMFPMIESVEQAQRAVAATRFAPLGSRGLTAMSRASRYGTLSGYVRHADTSQGVVVQLETAVALERLEAICAVDGVDAVFVGPSDLSASLGHGGQPGHPDVMRAMGTIVQRCKAVGMPVGTVGQAPDLVVQYRAMGFDYIGVASDIALLMRGAQDAITALRTPDVETHVHSLTTGTRTASADTRS